MHDPGGKVRMPLQPGVRGMAAFSECGLYRYWLSRFWNEPRHAVAGTEPYALWVGMNPSTAEEYVDDPTIRKELVWSALTLLGYLVNFGGL